MQGGPISVMYMILGKMVSLWEAFSGKLFICCALTILYSIYNTVGRSIASISDLGGIFTSVAYIRYGPPYRTIYITYSLGANQCSVFLLTVLAAAQLELHSQTF